MADIKIAVTGGIGAGKSTVCDIIRGLGYAVYSCDEIYAQLTTQPKFCERIAEITGVPLLSGGVLNRPAISEKAFNNKAIRSALEAFTHPAIMAELMRKMEGHSVSFAEVPLLFENGLEKMFDHTIVVMRDEGARIASVVSGRGLSEEQVRMRIKNQFDYEKLNAEGHTVIYNDADMSDLGKQVGALVREIISKAN